MKLRPYQQAAVQSVFNYFSARDGWPIIVLPTAGGKSIIQAAFLQRVFEYPGQRVILATHVKELIQQNHDRLLELWPEAPVGIYSAGLKRRDTRAPITVPGIQSVYKRAAEFGAVDLVIIDEAHLVAKAGDGMYRAFLSALKTTNPKLKVIGMTATPYRMASGYLHKGKGALFTDIAYEAKVPELVRDGYVCPLISKAGKTRADLSGVKVRAKEYVASELEGVMNTQQLVTAAVDEILTHCAARNSWLVFCSGVKHAHAVAKELQKHVAAACVTGSTPADTRARILADFKAGRLCAVTNVNVLTTGLDVPGIDAIIMLRPTLSPGLFYQMAGRGMRLHSSKADTLVLDFAGNTLRHGPIDQIRVGKPREETDSPPARECPACQSVLAIHIKVCPDCGHVFVVKPRPSVPKHAARAGELPILSDGRRPRPERVDVDKVRYLVHNKPGKPPSMRVVYHCGLITYSEWICFEHGGYAAQKAVEWWRRRSARANDMPTKTADALALASVAFKPEGEAKKAYLATPTSITVDTSEKYARIVSYSWETA